MEKVHPFKGSRACARMRCDKDGLVGHDVRRSKYQITQSEVFAQQQSIFQAKSGEE
jgi:hypothetical protein